MPLSQFPNRGLDPANLQRVVGPGTLVGDGRQQRFAPPLVKLEMLYDLSAERSLEGQV